MTRTVAVIGASTDRRKFGNKAVRAHLAAGYTVYPVNPQALEVESLPAYASLSDVPAGPLDRVTVYVPPAIGRTILPAIAARAPAEVWFNPGADDPGVLAEARRWGLNVIVGCSIVALGFSPQQFPDE
ncbi:MAG: CoA-binding protein [Gemmataceae bacterium]|nr:CoA-binding protein [Gemmata sp.]MDW8199002.1 CoA-binding protein [Gemmataceae bacterium]